MGHSKWRGFECPHGYASLRSGIKAHEGAEFVAREQLKTAGTKTTTSEESSAERMKAK